MNSLTDRIITRTVHFFFVLQTSMTQVFLPVDSAWTLVGFDVHLVVVDVHLGDLHLKVVGQQLDGLPNGAHAWPPGSLEDILQGRGVQPHGH